MAKLNGPLLSFGASGSIADTITFTKRKRQNIAKSHAVPSNPNSTAQAAQRTLVGQASAAINAAKVAPADPFNQEDVDGFNLYAKANGLKATWHNLACQQFINTSKLGDTPGIFRGTVNFFNGAQWTPYTQSVNIDGVTLTTCHIYYGFSPSVLLNVGVCTLDPVNERAYFIFWSIVANTRYYWTMVVPPGGGCEGMHNGIHYFDT